MDLKLIKRLRQEKADLIRASGSILDKEADGKATAEDLETYAINGKRLDQIEGQIGRVEQQMDRERSLEALRDLQDEREAAAAAEAEEVEATGGPAQKGRAKSKFSSFGEFLQAVAQAGLSKDTGRAIDPRLLELQPKPGAAASGLNESIASEGGFVVGSDYIAEIWKRTYASADLLSRVRRIPIGPLADGLKMNAIDESSRADGSRWGGVQAFWQDEADAFTGSKPKFRVLELKLEKLTGLCYATSELLKDAAALEGLIMEILPEELKFRAEDAIYNGDGVSKPLGLLKSGAVIQVAAEGGQAPATVLSDNVLKMYNRMPAALRAKAIWAINQEIEPQLWRMTMGAAPATPMFLPPGGMVDAPSGLLMGKPIVPFEYAAKLGTPGDIMFIAPDQYLLIDKGGIEAASSMHVRFLNDEQTFRFIYRLDGEALWDKPLTPKNGSAGYTLSPFVALAAR
jgi:HK97 family phage major capsid protein